jgi:hypothetical protein
LQDAFVAMLAGAHGLVEVNTRVRSDAALQRAFGRNSCAEQSVVQETLDRCTAENVRQMEETVDAIFRAHSRAYRHDYRRGLLLLDVDLTGLPCGKRAEEAKKGYLSGYGVRRGRQMGRVMASAYDDEVVVELGKGERIKRVVLNSGSALGRACARPYGCCWKRSMCVTLGET